MFSPMSACHRLIVSGAVLLLALTAGVQAQVPHLLNYQGRVIVDDLNFDGAADFRFAFVDGAGTTTYWSNDGTSVAGSEPVAAVPLTVSQGLYSVLLGDTALANMDAIPTAVFANPEVHLRVWFDDGTNGSLLLTPDQRIAAVGYALRAEEVESVLLADVQAPPVSPVLAWGTNLWGETSVPDSLSAVVAIAGGDSHSVALLAGGTLVSWGDTPAATPTDPATLTGVTGIAAGQDHLLALRDNGTVAAWGRNAEGQSTVPGGLTNVVAVAAGEKHSLALKDDGTLVAWGDNTFGQTTIPGPATGVTAIAAGADHGLALKDDGTVEAWGRNDVGQCDVPVGLTDVVAIAAGDFHSLAVKDDGTVVAWGWDLAGQSTVPAGLTGVVEVVGGYGFSVALKSDGTAVAWGDDSDGQISAVPGLANIQAFAAGSRHLLALQDDLLPAQVARLDQDNTFTEKMGIGRSPVTNRLEVDGQASKSIAGNWLANSDRRIKTQVSPISGALDLIDRLNPVTFHYTEEHLARHPEIDDIAYYNVIAQEFREVFPEAVTAGGDRLPDGSPVLQVDTYPALITSLAAVQELHEGLREKDREIEELEKRLERIEALLEAGAK